MMKRAVLLFAVVVLAFADDSTNSTETNDYVPPVDYVAGMIQMEQYMATKYLDIILKFQHAQYQHFGSMYLLQSQLAEQKATALDEEEQLDSEGDLEEDDEAPTESPAKLRLLGAYYLLNSVHVKLYQILVKAPEVQMEYFYNRAIQMSLGAYGSQLPAPFYQVLYMQSLNNNLKTLKLSYALQYVSHFRTWLEDEIDVNGAITANDVHAGAVAEQQEDDLLMDRQFAFSSYYHLALIDFQTFMLDMYTQQMFAQIAGAQPASFLEEEASVGEQASFFPFMGGNNWMDMYTVWLRWYHIILQLSAAQSGQYSVQLEYYAQHAEESAKVDDDKVQESSRFAFTNFASILLQASQVQYYIAMLSMWSMYMPVAPQMAK